MTETETVMARRRPKSSRKTTRISSAMSAPIARRSLLRNPQPLTIFEDRRTWTPAPIGLRNPPPRNYATTSRTGKRISSPKWKPVFNVSFADPQRTFICVRRKRRKEVMFALRKTGKGSAARKRRRNFWSRVSC
ncbi:hypothetical protein [Eel River basin pequenovirus]|nr:hypothetical protein [Eel River basin pequenovirus]